MCVRFPALRVKPSAEMIYCDLWSDVWLNETFQSVSQSVVAETFGFSTRETKKKREALFSHGYILEEGGRSAFSQLLSCLFPTWPAEVAACQRHSHIQPRYSLWHCPRFANSFISLICFGTSPSEPIVRVIHCVFTGVCFDACHSRLDVCGFVHLFFMYSIYVHVCPNYHWVNCNQKSDYVLKEKSHLSTFFHQQDFFSGDKVTKPANYLFLQF